MNNVQKTEQRFLGHFLMKIMIFLDHYSMFVYSNKYKNSEIEVYDICVLLSQAAAARVAATV